MTRINIGYSTLDTCQWTTLENNICNMNVPTYNNILMHYNIIHDVVMHYNTSDYNLANVRIY